MSESVFKGLPKRFRGLYLLMFVMIASGIGAVITSQLLRTSPLPSPTVAPPAIQAVTALGRLEPKGEVIQLSAPNQGSRVGQLLVKVGDMVRKGQVIAYLDTRDRAVASVEQALEQVKVQQTRLAIVKAGAKTGEIQAQSATVERVKAQLQEELAARDATISRIQAEVQNAAREYKRYQFLQIEGAVSASLRDDKKLTVDVAQQRLNEAKANRRQTEETLVKQIKEARSTLSKIAEVRPVDVMAAQAEVDRAKAAVKQAQAELDLAVIKAPRDGQILRVNTWAGEIIDTQKGIVSLGETSQMYAVAEVYETDLPRIRAGQTAIITSVSGGVLTEPIAGVVDEIGLEVMKKDVLNTDPAADIDARVVEVKIRLNAADSRKVAGFSNMKLKVAVNL
ncbi:hemolysin D [Dulcicalothrix desertica PCC 7102]|uniref:Hemolysin D n=1 Tax=Dulcicalothrix desertica PCC 7102 TaxID=232991 RepID=A0A433UFA2_9CYAN|nr:ABC exporter membrane fusion protein [Dulcicalothrix desertica]RUS92493.1 hemolysin D [Dulcicalothrix desertica PCC 7102]TWH42565.1 HlyD family secretion protein [Dulcicalothrix desertica PCC 7102]